MFFSVIGKHNVSNLIPIRGDGETMKIFLSFFISPLWCNESSVMFCLHTLVLTVYLFISCPCKYTLRILGQHTL